MKNQIQRLVSAFVAITCAIALANLGESSANAAGTAPTDAKAVLVTPFLDATNTSEAAANQSMADGWVKNGWFGSGLVFQRTFIPVGSTINLTYHITDKNGNPLVNQAVKLRINKGYSQSTSIVEVDGMRTKGVDKPPADQAQVTHITDGFGNVTFAVKNLDQPPMGEPEPDSLTSAPNISADGLNDLHSQMLLEIAGEKPDHSVITEFHYFLPKKIVNYSTTKPTLKLVTPILDDKNSYALSPSSKAIYAQAGSSTIVAYKVTDDNGLALPNAVVQIKNGSNTLSATSDAMGYAVFTIKNTATKGEAKPSAMNAKPPVSGAVSLTVTPTVVGSASVTADSLEIHYYGTPAAPKATSSTIKCVKGATIVKVSGINPTCPKGYKKG
jgi:hypothetical protein